MAHAARPIWQRSLLGPVVLIGLGVALLLTNLGYVPWDIWRSLWRFWPVLLILLGLELLLVGRASWGSILFAILVLFVFGLVAGASYVWAGLGRPHEMGSPGPLSPAFAQPLEGASEARISVEYGAGHLRIGPGAGEGILAEAEAADGERGRVSTRYRVRDGVGTLDVDRRADRPWRWFGGEGDSASALSIRLSESVPIRRLEVDAGAVDARLDLGMLQVANLDVDAGASNTLVRLPEAGQVSASLKAGASNLIVEVPQGVAARIRIEGGLSGISVDEQRFPSVRGEGVQGLAVEREFRSPDYEAAAHRVDLRVSAGAANVEIR